MSSNRIVTGPLRTTMLSLVWPVLAEQCLNTLVGLVDVYLAGNLREHAVEATSAVGFATYVAWLITMLFALVGTGTTAMVARAYGANDHRQGNAVANQSLMLACFLGLAGWYGMQALAPSFASWQNMQGVTFGIVVNYLRLDAISYAGSAFILIGGAALRGAGDMRTPMKILASVNVLNIVLSCLLVYGLGPIPALGVRGIVIGTVVARLLGGALMVRVLFTGQRDLQLHRQLWQPRLDLIWRIFRIGAPAAIDGAVMWSGHFLFLMIIARLRASGAEGPNPDYAAQIVVVRLEALTYLPGAAWSAACATMIGQALGARDPARALRVGHEGVRQCGLLTGCVGLLFLVFARPICGLLHTDPAVIETAVPVLRLAGVIQPIMAVTIVYQGSLRGAGDTLVPLIFTTIGLALVRVPGAYIVAMVAGFGLFGAWTAVAADMVLRAALLTWRFTRATWTRSEV